jgi:hypothetical protein
MTIFVLDTPLKTPLEKTKNIIKKISLRETLWGKTHEEKLVGT